MKIVYLPSTIQDIEWMAYYYQEVFPEGACNLRKHLYALEKTLSANPFIGHTFENTEVRELHIPKTPFSLIYQISEFRIEILRFWDQRRDEADMNF